MTNAVADSAGNSEPRSRSLGGIRHRIAARVYRPLAGLIAAFAGTALVVPMFAAVSINDDWVYARSVELLMSQGKIVILDLSSAVNPFQTLWAGMFSYLFGTSLGVFRLSTFVMVLLGALAFYGLCRELGLTQRLSVLGTAMYLFNPINFSFAYTFMTDPHFISLLIIASYFYVRGLQRGIGWLVVLGSVIAACSFLVRQHGILLPFAFGTYLLFTRRLSFKPKGLLTGVQVAGIPLLVAGLYVVWVANGPGVTGGSALHARDFLEAPLSDRIKLLGNLTFVTVMYSGFFVLALAAALVPRVPDLAKNLTTRGKRWLAVYGGVLLGGVVGFAMKNKYMPYLPDRLSRHGIGTSDLIGSRPAIFGTPTMVIFTALVAASALVIVLIVNATGRPKSSEEGRLGYGALMVAAIVQAIFLFILSHWFRNDVVTVDRYVLVLMPFLIWALLIRVRHLNFSLTPAWVVIALLGVFAVAGTRDHLVFHESVWDLAADARAMGIPMNKLDAGAGNDGYFVSDGGNLPRPAQTPNPPWWIPYFAPDIDSTYMITTIPIQGYSVVFRRPYPQVLQSDTAWLYLSKRQEIPGCPPACPLPAPLTEKGDDRRH